MTVGFLQVPIFVYVYTQITNEFNGSIYTQIYLSAYIQLNENN